MREYFSEAVEDDFPALFAHHGPVGVFEEDALVCADQVGSAGGGEELEGYQNDGDRLAGVLTPGFRW